MRIAEVDPSLSRQLDGQLIPGFRTMQVVTGATLRSGQTLVLNGLKQQRAEALQRDGRREEHDNELELLIRPIQQQSNRRLVRQPILFLFRFAGGDKTSQAVKRRKDAGGRS